MNTTPMFPPNHKKKYDNPFENPYALENRRTRMRLMIRAQLYRAGMCAKIINGILPCAESAR